MDLSVMDNADLNRERNRAEQEKRKLAEELERTKEPKQSMNKLSLTKIKKSVWK